MYCSNCGREINDDAKFCRYCGHDLSSDESVSSCKEEEHKTADGVVTTETATITTTEEQPPKKMRRSQRIKRQREIEDARALENYTVTDTMVKDADILPSDRIEFLPKGSLTSLKVKEIVYIVLCGLVMIGTSVALYFIRTTTRPDEESMSGLVILGYFLFFIIFFALAIGVDRVYNLFTLNELATRRITLRRYGLRMDPLTLKDGKVYSLDVRGECDKCNTEIKGTYHIEWQGDELIAVCSYDRKHLYRIDKADILGDEVSDDGDTDIHPQTDDQE